MILRYFVSTLVLYFTVVRCVKFNETIEWPSKFDLSQVELGLRLLRNVAKSGTSTVVSPLSVGLALAVIDAGANGLTKEELRNLLAKDISNDDLDSYYKTLWHKFSKHHHKSHMNSDTKFLIDKRMKILNDYVKTIHEMTNSNTVIDRVDFQNADVVSQDTNEWADKHLGETNKKMIEVEMFPESARAALVTVASMDALWYKPFNKFATHRQLFYITKDKQKKVSVMAQSEYFMYYSDETLNAIALPYKDCNVSLYIFLPNETFDLRNFEKHFTAKKLFRIIRSMKKTYVDMVIPKFRMERQYELQYALNRMGVADAFSEQANFTSISSELFHISVFYHKSVVRVCEQGTDLSEKVDFDWKFIPIALVEPVQFVADHPFIFAVFDADTLLFIGRYRG